MYPTNSSREVIEKNEYSLFLFIIIKIKTEFLYPLRTFFFLKINQVREEVIGDNSGFTHVLRRTIFFFFCLFGVYES